MSETPQTLGQIIEVLQGPGLLIGGRQSELERTQALSHLPAAIEAIRRSTQEAFYARLTQAAESLQPGFLLQAIPPDVSIRVVPWNLGTISLTQLGNADWQRYADQAERLLSPYFPSETRAQLAQDLAKHERDHVGLIPPGAPYSSGLTLEPNGQVVGHVGVEAQLDPVIMVCISLAVHDPSPVDLNTAATNLIAASNMNASVEGIFDLPGYPKLWEYPDYLEAALFTDFGGGEGIKPDNPLFIGDHNRERLFGDIPKLLRDL